MPHFPLTEPNSSFHFCHSQQNIETQGLKSVFFSFQDEFNLTVVKATRFLPLNLFKTHENEWTSHLGIYNATMGRIIKMHRHIRIKTIKKLNGWASLEGESEVQVWKWYFNTIVEKSTCLIGFSFICVFSYKWRPKQSNFIESQARVFGDICLYFFSFSAQLLGQRSTLPLPPWPCHWLLLNTC